MSRWTLDVEQTVNPTTALALAIVGLTPSFSSGVPTTCLGKCVGVVRPLALIVDHNAIFEHKCTSFIVLVALFHSWVLKQVHGRQWVYLAPLTSKELRPNSPNKGEQPDCLEQVAHTPQKPPPLDMRLQHHHACQEQLGPMHGQMRFRNMLQHHPGMMH